MGEILKIFTPAIKRGHFAIVNVRGEVKDGQIPVDVLFEGEDCLGDKFAGLGIARSNLSKGKDTGFAINPEEDVEIPD
jgi:hypothetical protein